MLGYGFLVLLVPPAIAVLAHALYPERRILGKDPGAAAGAYFFGVVAALVAMTLAS